MRISDWSSDVCSSDLHAVRLTYARCNQATAPPFQKADIQGDFCERESRNIGAVRRDGRPCAAHALSLALQSSSRWSADRKSVVSGKSVSVRVDLGGRRIIKKKENE